MSRRSILGTAIRPLVGGAPRRLAQQRHLAHRSRFARVALALVVSSLGVWLTPMPTAAQVECPDDDSLGRAALALMAQPTVPTGAELTQAARDAGSDAPVVRLRVLRDGDLEGRERLVREAAERWGSPLACGEARSDGQWLVLVAPAAGHLVALSDDRLRVELAQGWRDARIVARDRRGESWQRTVESGREVGLPSDLELPLVVQLVANGPAGPRPVAERRFGEGVEPTVVDSDEPPLARVARLRASRSVGALRDNRLLERVALAHAEAVCRDGRVGHLGSEGDPEQRLLRSGIAARHVGETVARARTAPEAYAATVRSPSHRAALTDGRFTDVGMGTAARDGHHCLVVLLAAWPRPVAR